MERYRKSNNSHILVCACLFLIVVTVVVVILVNVFNKNIVINPGVLTLDDSLTESEKSFLTATFSDKTLKDDVIISAKTEYEYPEPSSLPQFNQILYDTLIPVSNFYNVDRNLTHADAAQLPTIEEPVIDSNDNNFYLISLSKIDGRVRAATIDNNYYFDNYLNRSNESENGSPKPERKYTGALFRIFTIDSNSPAEAYSIISSALPSIPTDATILSINQTGVTALTRQMLNKLNVVKDGAFFAEKVGPYLSSADITHTSNEVSFADNCSNSTDMAFCADWRMFDALTGIGVDVIELTGNHNNDWGASNDIATIDFYHEKGIKTFGGGKTEEEAATPLEINDKENHITWIGVNNSTSNKANGQGASGDHPGANIYNEDLTRTKIQEAKNRGDYVIVDVQFFECWSYPAEGAELPSCDLPISGQEVFFRNIIDMGADMVVGTQAHQPQTYELYHNKPIYYGLGNLFFDQTLWPGTRRSLILTHFFYGDKLLQTRILPTIYDRNFQPEIMSESDARAYLDRLSAYYK